MGIRGCAGQHMLHLLLRPADGHGRLSTQRCAAPSCSQRSEWAKGGPVLSCLLCDAVGGPTPAVGSVLTALVAGEGDLHAAARHVQLYGGHGPLCVGVWRRCGLGIAAAGLCAQNALTKLSIPDALQQQTGKLGTAL
jgi:hypothetical protein